jgi:hypothetical protein
VIAGRIALSPFSPTWDQDRVVNIQLAALTMIAAIVLRIVSGRPKAKITLSGIVAVVTVVLGFVVIGP